MDRLENKVRCMQKSFDIFKLPFVRTWFIIMNNLKYKILYFYTTKYSSTSLSTGNVSGSNATLNGIVNFLAKKEADY